MKIRSLDNNYSLAISAQQTEDAYLPSVGISFVLRGAISFEKRNVWYTRNAIDGFVAALQRLEGSRNGDAVLDSMSPGECSIRMQCRGSMGSILCHLNAYEVTHFREAPKYSKNVATVSFAVDRELLLRIVADFSGLLGKAS